MQTPTIKRVGVTASISAEDGFALVPLSAELPDVVGFSFDFEAPGALLFPVLAAGFSLAPFAFSFPDDSGSFPVGESALAAPVLGCEDRAESLFSSSKS